MAGAMGMPRSLCAPPSRSTLEQRLTLAARADPDQHPPKNQITVLLLNVFERNLMFPDLLVQRCSRNTKCLAGRGDTSSALAELDLDEVTLELGDLICKRGKRLWRST